MKILNKNNIDNAAHLEAESRYDVNYHQDHIDMFKEGAEYAEEQLSKIAVEFAEWLDNNFYARTLGNHLWEKSTMTVSNDNIPCTTKELFKQFIKEKNNGD